MKTTNSIIFSLAALFFLGTSAIGQDGAKLVSSRSQIKFFSTTPAEDIEAFNTASVSTINKETGEVVFSIPMQGFEFEKSLMQKHFNNDKFLDTQTYPNAKLTGKITNLNEIDFAKEGSYPATVEGEITIKGKTNPIKEQGNILVKGGQVDVESVFDVALADFGITFMEGKPSTNIAKTVEVTVQAQYQEQ